MLGAAGAIWGWDRRRSIAARPRPKGGRPPGGLPANGNLIQADVTVRLKNRSGRSSILPHCARYQATVVTTATTILPKIRRHRQDPARTRTRAAVAFCGYRRPSPVVSILASCALSTAMWIMSTAVRGRSVSACSDAGRAKVAAGVRRLDKRPTDG